MLGGAVDREGAGSKGNVLPYAQSMEAKTSVTLKTSQFYNAIQDIICLLYTSPSPRDATLSRMPSSA